MRVLKILSVGHCSFLVAAVAGARSDVREPPQHPAPRVQPQRHVPKNCERPLPSLIHGSVTLRSLSLAQLPDASFACVRLARLQLRRAEDFKFWFRRYKDVSRRLVPTDADLLPEADKVSATRPLISITHLRHQFYQRSIPTKWAEAKAEGLCGGWMWQAALGEAWAPFFAELLTEEEEAKLTAEG